MKQARPHGRAVRKLFDVFVLAVTRGERKATVGMSVGVEDTDVKERTLESSSPEAACSNVQTSSILSVRSGSGECLTSDGLKVWLHTDVVYSHRCYFLSGLGHRMYMHIHAYTYTCDLFCINQPFTTNLSFEKNSCIDFELSLLIDYTSYHYEIFSVASTEQDLYRD